MGLLSNFDTNGVIVSSTPSLEGKVINEYLQLVAATSVLGTGFLSELSSSFADFTGGSSYAYESKLTSAKEHAISEMVIQAKRLGANAIVGVDVDYVAFSKDLIGVAVYGTAVVCSDAGVSENYIDYPIVNYNSKVPFNLLSLKMLFSETAATGRVFGVTYAENITAMTGILEYISPFGDTLYKTNVLLNHIDYTGNEFSAVFHSSVNNQHLYADAELAKLTVSKYILDGVIQEVETEYYKTSTFDHDKHILLKQMYGEHAVRESALSDEIWECSCGCDNSINAQCCERCGSILTQKVQFALNNKAPAVKPEFNDNGQIICPTCGKVMSPRPSCWKCGTVFDI